MENGISLFQGAGSLHINNSAQDRLQEQEELEDQKRRNKELEQELENAFDDLVDDDEASSVNSSVNFTMNLQQSRTNQGTNGHEIPRTRNPPTYVESLTQLKDPNLPEVPHNSYNNTPRANLGCYPEEGRYYSPCGAGDMQENDYFHQNHQHTPLNGLKNLMGAKQELMNYEQLKTMHEMRVKECQQLAGDLAELQQRADAEADSLRARLAAATTDRDKAQLSLQQAHHLISSSKHKIVKLEQAVSSANERLAASEQDKEQLKLELRAATSSLQDAQQRLHTLQVSRTHDTDALFREQQDRHREELDRFQEDLEKARNRISEKENEVKILERRCKETDRAKEELIIEKGATINRLAAELEEAQSRIVNGEGARLKEKISQLTSERNMAREQVKELGSKLESTAHELVLCRNKLSSLQEEYDDWRTTLQQILQDSLPEAAYLGNSPPHAKLGALKDVLNKYKAQTQRCNSLQDEITKKDKKLESFKKIEADLKAKLEERKGIEMQLNSRLVVLQNKLELLGNSDDDLLESYKQQAQDTRRQLDEAVTQLKDLELRYAELEMAHEKLKRDGSSRKSLEREANAELLRELERLTHQLKDALRENSELKTLYLQVCSSKDACNRELQDIKSKLQTFQKEKDTITSREKLYSEQLDKERLQIERLTKELAREKDELERANKRISELQKEFTDKQKDFNERLNQYIKDETSAVRKEMEACLQCEKKMKIVKQLETQIGQLNLKIATYQSNEALIQELRSKADFFQKYIMDKFQKLQDQRNVSTNTENQELHTQHIVETGNDERKKDQYDDYESTDEIFTSRNNILQKEKQIREEIAEKFTLEIKTIELNCTKRIKELENDHASTVSKLKQLLEKKTEEVETLKMFVQSEKTKMNEIVQLKQKEMMLLLKQNQSLQEEYEKLREKATEFKAHLEKAQNKITRLKVDLERRTAGSASEMERSSKAQGEMRQKLKALATKSEEIEAQYDILKDKYRNVKKTALVYKEYASKKDAHVESELDRIRTHYEDIITHLQDKLQAMVKKRHEYEVKDRLNTMDSD